MKLNSIISINDHTTFYLVSTGLLHYVHVHMKPINDLRTMKKNIPPNILTETE